ncbi:MAG: hypothetical protein KA140_05885 [Caldisericia bacterium]|nr:hypothetical protein [Caldisericia bacterium]
MSAFINQLKLLFSKPSQAVDDPPSATTSLLWFCVILLATFALLFKNTFNTSIVSVSPVQLVIGIGRLEMFLANVSVQLIVLCVPFAIVLGMDGLKKLVSNLALLQIPGLVIAIFGFVYEIVLWPLYKKLPVSGLEAKAAFDAVFLLYPALLMMVYRYVLIWIVAIKSGASGAKVSLMVAIHLVLCLLLYLAGGVL